MNIEKTIRKIPVVMWLGYKIRAIKHHNKMRKYVGQSINNKQILLASTNGAFNDSPRAVAEYIHNHHLAIRLIWVYKNESQLVDIPNYVIPVKFNSDEYYQALSTSCVWLMCYLLPEGTIKRAGQLYIQAWHGDKPFKKIVNDAAAENKEYRRRTIGRKIIENEICDYTLTGCNFFKPIWRSATGYQGKFIDIGLPRNDCLINTDISRKQELKHLIFDRYGIPFDAKVLLYAPTQRDHRIDTETLGSDIDIPAMLKTVKEHFGGEWWCIIRAHSGNRLEIKSKEGQKDKILDFTSYPDIADLLIISDMLITDYSSCAGDFALTNKPVLLYQDDYLEYTTKDRTLYVDMEETPFWVAHNLEDAARIISGMTEASIIINDDAINQFYGTFEKGNATERLIKTMFNSIET